LTYVEVDLLSWSGQRHPDSQGNSILSHLENNHCNKAFLDQTGVIIKTNAIGALLQQFYGQRVPAVSANNGARHREKAVKFIASQLRAKTVGKLH
jgi:hypothetical protein